MEQAVVEQEIEIVPMTDTDLISVVTIEKETFTDPWTLENFKEGLKWEQSLYLVAKSSSQVVGYFCALIGAEEIHITNLAVRKEYRQLRIGRCLVERGLLEGKNRGCQTAWLDVRASNLKAQTLYNRLGFQKVATRKKYYRQPVEDAYILCCSLMP